MIYLYVLRVEPYIWEITYLDFRLFERLDEEAYSVFEDKSLMSLSYVPDDLVCRDRQEEYFASMLTRGVAENFLPPMIRVFGRTGSGKTAVVRSVLERFSRYRGEVFRQFYVNLKSCRTVFSAGNALLSAICGRRVPVNLGFDRAFTEIWDELRGLKGEGGRLYVCLVLDEVDSIFMDKHFDPSDFFYRFIRPQMYLGDVDIKICLVLITNNPLVLEDNLDARVKSSMGSEMIMFPRYSREELTEILRARLDGAFGPEMVEVGVVEECADLVAKKTGDARKAIDLLRVSGEIANELKTRVTVDCVQLAMERVERDWIQEELMDLKFNSAIILSCIAVLSIEKEKTSTRELYYTYKNATIVGDKEKIRRLSERRILDIVKELASGGLISTWNVSKGRGGYGKEIKMNIDPQKVLDFYKQRSVKHRFYIEATKTI